MTNDDCGFAIADCGLMKQELTLTKEPIDEAALLAKRAMSAGMGAAVYFAGVVRGARRFRRSITRRSKRWRGTSSI